MPDSTTRKPLGLLGGLLVLILGAFGYLQLDGKQPTADGATPDSSAADTSNSTSSESQPADTSTPETRPSDAATPTPARHAWVEGPNGRLDIAPTLERIERGEKHPHRNDGSVFQNRERRLPGKPRGYYREFVHPTPGSSGPGAQRVVIGDDRDVWYTPDHYETFQSVAWTFRSFPR